MKVDIFFSKRIKNILYTIIKKLTHHYYIVPDKAKCFFDFFFKYWIREQRVCSLQCIFQCFLIYSNKTIIISNLRLFLTFNNQLSRLFNLTSRVCCSACKRASIFFISCCNKQNCIVSFINHLQRKKNRWGNVLSQRLKLLNTRLCYYVVKAIAKHDTEPRFDPSCGQSFVSKIIKWICPG